MKAIWKFNLEVEGEQTIEMPQGARFLAVQNQDEFCAWAIVDTKAKRVERRVLIVGTGHRLTDEGEYIATVQDGPYVWHVFDGGEL